MSSRRRGSLTDAEAHGDSFSGDWRPNPGADETVNTPYDVAATRVK